ncbi:MAG: hypothetical protein J6B09_02395 [Clostridia bacterium]|nr:hypothetical protein [Clostridia bacterium]
MKNKKKLIAVIVSVALVLIALIVTVVIVAVRKNRPPELEEVRGRFEEVLNASGEINEIFWGEGLPTYPRIYEEPFSFKDSYFNGETSEEKTIKGITFDDGNGRTIVAYRAWMFFIPDGQEDGIYYDFENNAVLAAKPNDDFYRFAERVSAPREGATQNAYLAQNLGGEGYYYYSLESYDIGSVFFYTESDDENYDFVRLDCGYLSVEDIKLAAAKVYSPSYLASVGESIFTGVIVSDTAGVLLWARYMDHEDSGSGEMSLVKYNKDKGLTLTDWVYDFSTMRIADGSNAAFVTVELERYPAGNEGAREVCTQRFALENGEWYLDSPSY